MVSRVYNRAIARLVLPASVISVPVAHFSVDSAQCFQNSFDRLRQINNVGFGQRLRPAGALRRLRRARSAAVNGCGRTDADDLSLKSSLPQRQGERPADQTHAGDGDHVAIRRSLGFPLAPVQILLDLAHLPHDAFEDVAEGLIAERTRIAGDHFRTTSSSRRRFIYRHGESFLARTTSSTIPARRLSRSRNSRSSELDAAAGIRRAIPARPPVSSIHTFSERTGERFDLAHRVAWFAIKRTNALPTTTPSAIFATAPACPESRCRSRPRAEAK